MRPEGFPGFSLPVVDIQSLKPLLSVALTISLVGFMESLAVAQRIASKENYELNANQELRALGLANIVGSFFPPCPSQVVCLGRRSIIRREQKRCWLPS